jgi:GT2 family glycosyltransferase
MPTDTPAISVVIPCYNGARFLRETLASVTRQTYPADEVIVVDDGSTDGSAAIAEAFGPPVCVVRQPNQGESAARNRGIALARGEWVALLDADDLWEPTKLARQGAALRFAPPDTVCVYTDYFKVLDGARVACEQPREWHAEPDARVRLLFDWSVIPSSVLLRRDVLAEVRFPEAVRHGEDVLFFAHLRRHGSFLRVAEPLTGYRISPSQQTRSRGHTVGVFRSKAAWFRGQARHYSPEERAYVYVRLRAELTAAHDVAWWRRDGDLVRQYRGLFGELFAGEPPPPSFRKDLYPRFLYQIKDRLDEWFGAATPRRGPAPSQPGTRRILRERPMSQSTAVYDARFYAGLAEWVAASARVCVPLIMELLAPRSVIDVGCGQGDWLHAFGQCGVEDYLGIDGDHVQPEALRIPAASFRPWDLTHPLEIGRRFDLAVCLEVGEHLPERCAPFLVHSLTSAAPAVVFSAAIPGQGGVRHINEQWPWYWQELFAAAGYRCLDVFRKALWQHPEVAPFYQQNLYLFVAPDSHGALIDRNPEAQGTQLTLVQTFVLKNLTRKNPFFGRLLERLRRLLTRTRP